MRKWTALAAVGLVGVFLGHGEGWAAKPAQTKTNFTAADQQVAPKKKKTIKITTAKITKKKKTVAVAAIVPKRSNAMPRRSDCDGFFECLFGDSRGSSRGQSGFGIGGSQTRRIVDWDENKYKPGSIIVRTPERALYYVLPDGQAYRYKVGVGREGFQWGGTSRIVSKQEWPEWRPPEEMKRREAEKGHILPDVMEGGPENPLGARALYIGGTLFRIHGTNNAASIGGAVSSGCIRMMNSDVIDLYERVRVGARVHVYQ
jgi:lipoprotein-anchoring transpeptidase ErfK/SrfK